LPAAAPKTLFLLMDGLGLGSRDPSVNPIYRGSCPTLQRLLDADAVPIDATLGMPGLPQSATGQTALFTGINAARHMGRHVEGFPGPALRALIRRDNLYDQLAARGYTATFANAYYVTDLADVRARRLQSVTTVSALKAFGRVRDREAMLAGKAVYQDLTRESLRARGYEGPLVSPSDSARDLLAIARDHDFTVFEYFQTDRAGHKGTPDDILRVLALCDEFLAGLLPFALEPGCLLALTSDHGNIEDATSRAHSAHPVPWLVKGHGADVLRTRVRSLTDVAPALLALYPPRPGASLGGGTRAWSGGAACPPRSRPEKSG
jgi:2,3-bisphosphoglycerate-independent phosphoglycerate mutase